MTDGGGQTGWTFNRIALFPITGVACDRHIWPKLTRWDSNVLFELRKEMIFDLFFDNKDFLLLGLMKLLTSFEQQCWEAHRRACVLYVMVGWG